MVAALCTTLITRANRACNLDRLRSLIGRCLSWRNQSLPMIAQSGAPNLVALTLSFLCVYMVNDWSMGHRIDIGNTPSDLKTALLSNMVHRCCNWKSGWCKEGLGNLQMGDLPHNNVTNCIDMVCNQRVHDALAKIPQETIYSAGYSADNAWATEHAHYDISITILGPLLWWSLTWRGWPCIFQDSSTHKHSFGPSVHVQTGPRSYATRSHQYYQKHSIQKDSDNHMWRVSRPPFTMWPLQMTNLIVLTQQPCTTAMSGSTFCWLCRLFRFHYKSTMEHLVSGAVRAGYEVDMFVELADETLEESIERKKANMKHAPPSWRHVWRQGPTTNEGLPWHYVQTISNLWQLIVLVLPQDPGQSEV